MAHCKEKCRENIPWHTIFIKQKIVPNYCRWSLVQFLTQVNQPGNSLGRVSTINSGHHDLLDTLVNPGTVGSILVVGEDGYLCNGKHFTVSNYSKEEVFFNWSFNQDATWWTAFKRDRVQNYVFKHLFA